MSELITTDWLNSLPGAHYMEDYDGKEVSQYYRFLVSPLSNIIVKRLYLYYDDRHEHEYSVSQGDKYLECETKEGLLNILEMWGWDKDTGMRSEKAYVWDDTFISYGWLLSLAGAKPTSRSDYVVFDNKKDVYIQRYGHNSWIVGKLGHIGLLVWTKLEVGKHLASYGWDSTEGFPNEETTITYDWLLSLAGAKESQVYPNRIVFDNNKHAYVSNYMDNEWFVAWTIENSKMVHTRMELKKILESFGWDANVGFPIIRPELKQSYGFEWVKTLPYFQRGFYNGNETLRAKTRLPNTMLEYTICGFVLNYTCSGTHHIQPIPVLKTKGDVLKLIDIFVDCK